MALISEIDDLFEEIIDIQDEAKIERETKNIDYIIEKVSPDEICDNVFNDVYNKFNTQAADEELEQSLCEHGLLENLVVTPNDSFYDTHYLDTGCKYRLISGHRRLNAIKQIIKNGPSDVAKRFMMVPIKIEKYNSPEEELLMLNTYNLHSRTLSAEDKLLLLSDIRKKLESLTGNRELDEKQKLIKSELRKYKSLFEGMAKATKSRYLAISAHSNPDVASLISEGFTIHQLAKIANFPGDTYQPLHILLSKEKQEELNDLLNKTGDLQAEVLSAVNFLKENEAWNNDVTIKNWRNYIVNNFITPVHACLQTAKSNCSAYNLATAAKDKENAITKINHQIDNIQDIVETFREGYTTGDIDIFNKETQKQKSNVEKFSSDFKKLSNKEEMLKVLKSIIKQASNSDVIPSDKAVEIMNLL